MEKMYGIVHDDAPMTIEERERRATAYRVKVHRRNLRKQCRRDRRIERINAILHKIIIVLAIILAVLICTGHAQGVI